MEYLDLTLPDAVENVALDEALLDEAEATDSVRETLRVWEAERPLVVVGRSSCIDREVQLDVCQAMGVPVVRRISGGAAVVAGLGCLMYTLVLDYRLWPELRTIGNAHRWVLNSIAAALRPHAPQVQVCGTSDLAIGGRKFSGNSARCRRRQLLYHGTLLYDFPLPLIERCLKMPPRTPDYRAGRSHAGFVANLPIDAATLRRLLIKAFDAREPRADWPTGRVTQLVAEKYGRREWNS